jgi:hypothetical protein
VGFPPLANDDKWSAFFMDAKSHITARPEDFEQSDEYKRIAHGQSRQTTGGDIPSVAFILPSTKESIAAASHLRDKGKTYLVGGIRLPGLITPADMLKQLSDIPDQRFPIVVFSDQILSPADASILVRTDEFDKFYSPFEAILNIKYGYRLAIWTMSGYAVVEPHAPDLIDVFEKLILHFKSCDSCGSSWDMKQMQSMRLPNVRNHNALRKLRFFRSAVINAYQDKPEDLAALDLLKQVSALELQVKLA